MPLARGNGGSMCPGVDLPGVFALRDIADATAIRERLGAKPKVVIIGAGFIGLEIAATAASLGAEATVVEIARPMGRAVSPIMSDFFLKEHGAFGARFRLGVGVAAIKGREHAETVILTDGEALSADMVVVGIGVVAEDALARECGLECDNGIVVDEFLRTSDSTISAIGDCTAFPHAALGMRTRLESVQNAVDQGRSVAARLMGKPKPYNELAWFWSDQGDLKLMIAGLAHGVSTWVVRGDPATRAFSTFGFRDGKLAVVEVGQQSRRPRRRQAHHRHDEDADAGRSGRSGVRSAGVGEKVGSGERTFCPSPSFDDRPGARRLEAGPVRNRDALKLRSREGATLRSVKEADFVRKAHIQGEQRSDLDRLIRGKES